MLAGSEIHRRLRSTIALALLVGIIGAIVLATAAGARRSGSALDRFNAYSHSSTLEISVGLPTAHQLRAFRRTPGIEATAMVRAFAFNVEGHQNLSIGAPLDDKIGNTVDRARLISGRRADPAAPEELTIGEALAAQLHAHVGTRLDAVSYTPKQVHDAFRGGQPGAPAGPRLQFTVVGIDRRPLDLSDRAANGGVVILTPAFNAKYENRIGIYTDSIRARTRRASDIPGVLARAREIFGSEQQFGVQSLGVEAEGAHDAIDVLTQALWIFAGVAALAGLVAIGIVLTRDIAQSAGDQSTLRALGVTRRQLVLVIGVGALIVAGAAALLAVVGALAASPLFPVGLARRADPDVGLHADWVVLLLGLGLVAFVVLANALLAALRATRTPSPGRARGPERRTSPIVEAAAQAGLRPTATNGLRMALQAGRGRSAVPVRSAFAGAVFGVAGITAVLVFAASLTHLVATPRLSGWTWDLRTSVPTARGASCADPADFGVARASGVAALAAVCQQDIEVDSRPVTAWGFRSLRGTIDPEVVSGRAPRGVDEIALGSVTLDALHKHVGDSVRARGPNGVRTYRVVGRIVLPTIGDPQPLADGASFTAAGLTPLLQPEENQTHSLLTRIAPGADRAATKRRVAALTARYSALSDYPGPAGTTTPVEVERLPQINWFPATLALLLAALALLAVGHALVTSVRRRRRELALLKTIGFDRGQVRATVAWQATTLAIIGVAAGIPIGLVVGRSIWRLVADGLGVANGATFPAPALVALALGALVLVNLVAFVPARTAARTRPAVALRSE
jgi:ABC-type lipoprotein release transport system permease subunit